MQKNNKKMHNIKKYVYNIYVYIDKYTKKWYYLHRNGDDIMSNLTSVININVPSEVKEEATSLFNSLGLNMSTAINMFLKKAIYERGIPFDIKQRPSKEFAEALQELDYMEKHPEEYKVYHNVDKMFEDILNEE